MIQQIGKFYPYKTLDRGAGGADQGPFFRMGFYVFPCGFRNQSAAPLTSKTSSNPIISSADKHNIGICQMIKLAVKGRRRDGNRVFKLFQNIQMIVFCSSLRDGDTDGYIPHSQCSIH